MWVPRGEICSIHLLVVRLQHHAAVADLAAVLSLLLIESIVNQVENRLMRVVRWINYTVGGWDQFVLGLSTSLWYRHFP